MLELWPPSLALCRLPCLLGTCFGPCHACCPQFVFKISAESQHFALFSAVSPRPSFSCSWAGPKGLAHARMHTHTSMYVRACNAPAGTMGVVMQGPGTAHISYADATTAARAVQAMNGWSYKGYQMSVVPTYQGPAPTMPPAAGPPFSVY